MARVRDRRAAPHGVGVNLKALHAYLWDTRYADDTITINQTELAAQVGVGPAIMSRKIKDLVNERRLTKDGNRKRQGRQLYVVTDPLTFAEPERDEPDDDEDDEDDEDT